MNTPARSLPDFFDYDLPVFDVESDEAGMEVEAPNPRPIIKFKQLKKTVVNGVKGRYVGNVNKASNLPEGIGIFFAKEKCVHLGYVVQSMFVGEHIFINRKTGTMIFSVLSNTDDGNQYKKGVSINEKGHEEFGYWLNGEIDLRARVQTLQHANFFDGCKLRTYTCPRRGDYTHSLLPLS
jgi:hypothetical protein